MNIRKPNRFKEKIISKLLGMVYRLDNSGNADLHANGEEQFINEFVADYRKKNPIIFDVGANKGGYARMVTEKFGGEAHQLHLFEPQAGCFSELRHLFEDNDRIVINNAGLSDAEDSVVLYKNEEGSGLASLYNRDLAYYGYAMSETEKISIIRADDYISQNDIPHIHLLKLDVEGHEMSALEGFGKFLNSEFIDFIQFEYGGANLDAHTNLLDFYHLLEPKGFTVCKIKKSYLETRTYNPRFENFVNQNYVAVSNKISEEIHTSR